MNGAVRQSTSSRARVVLAAGGTGGHVFPADALAEELLRRGYTPVLVTEARGGGYGDTLARIETHRIRAGKVAGVGPLTRLHSLLELAVGSVQARRLLRRLRPLAVVGFGGYASLPTVFEAARLGLPTLVHEQNGVLGRANRWLAPRVTRIATSFASVANLRPEDAKKRVWTGNPVRREIVEARTTPYPAVGADVPLRLLVLGGSQGAAVFSRVVPQAVALLAPQQRARLALAQQCRVEDLDSVRRAFDENGVDAELAPFFDDVPARLASTHLVISRAGASTIAELAVVGRPALLVPFLAAIDDHQTANARALDDAGGAWLMPEPSFTPATLASRLSAFLGSPTTLAEAAACARAAGVVDAATRLADAVEGMAVAAGRAKNGGRSAPAAREEAA